MIQTLQGSARETRPTYYSPYSGTGFGIVPRRGLDSVSHGFLWGGYEGLGLSGSCFGNGFWEGSGVHPLILAQFSAVFPLRLLKLLMDVNPIVSQARSNNLNLAFAPGDTRIVALKRTGDDAGKEEIDDAGTALLEDFFDAHGGLTELQVAGGEMAMYAGLLTYEGVPGPQGTGLADVFSFDPLSVQFRQGKPDEQPLVLQQNQAGMWKDLPGETVLWKAVAGTRDNPYGRPLFSAVVTEALEDVSIQRTLRDVLHGVAWPRLAVGFDLPMLIEFAKENAADLGLAPAGSAARDGGPMTITQWAVAQFQALQALMEQIKAKDVFIFTAGSEPKVLQGGNLQGTEGTLAMQRHRLVMAVDQPPTLLGIDSGGTLAYSSTQWKAYALKLEALRALVNTVLVRLANLHLRLLGLPLVAKAEVQPIRSEDLLMAAQARAVEISNSKQLIGMGFATAEGECVKLTGSGVVDPEKASRITGQADSAPGVPADPNAPQGAARPGAHAHPRPRAGADDTRRQEIRDGLLERARARREKREANK
jgi:hypothetical protein